MLKRQIKGIYKFKENKDDKKTSWNDNMQNLGKDLYNSNKNNKLELTKRRAEEARKITELNQERTGATHQNLNSHHTGLGNSFVNQEIFPQPPSWQPIHDPNGPFKSRPAREVAPRIRTVTLT